MMAGKRTGAIHDSLLRDAGGPPLSQSCGLECAASAAALRRVDADTVGNQRGPAMSVGYLSRHAVVCRMRRLQHTRDH